uniref:Carboxylesterase type B domain-containing protein n=1 Tax=Hucho hucho TaxID=62062 RepID=A0A4W5RF12_9TELE
IPAPIAHVDDLIDDLIVATNHGSVRGTQLPVPSGGYVRALLGIPYWNPRLGNCVFVLLSLQSGFRGAEMWNPNSKMSEGCLYLNIWTQLLLWFLIGSCHDVALWGRVHYRHCPGTINLGPLYFLSLLDSEVVPFFSFTLFLLLFFVLPCLINLFFMLAASVGLHLLSPGSHGLFNKAILQSGSPKTPLAVRTQQQAWNRTLSLGRLMGLSPDTSVCPGAVSTERISLSNSTTSCLSPTLIALPFTPSVDQNFLPDMPEVCVNLWLLTEVLIGSNQDEWTHFLVYGAPGYDITSQRLISREDFLKVVDLVLMGLAIFQRDGHLPVH